MAGLTEYRNQRQQEVAGRNTRQDGRPFHNDGQETLATVQQMHERLLERGEVRPGDYVTKLVIKEMVYSMLCDDPDGRDNAILLWKKSQRILGKGQKQIEKVDQRQRPPIGNHAISDPQAFDQHEPEKSSEVSYIAAKQLNGPSHVHGPPPFDPRYSSSIQSNGQSVLQQQHQQHQQQQQPFKKRSETWHDPSSTRVIAPGLHSTGLPSPASPHQLAGASTPPANYTGSRERKDTRATISGETMDRAVGEIWQGNIPLESEPVPQHGTRESTPPESRTSPKSYISRQIPNGAGLEPIHLQGIQESSPFGPPPRFNTQYLNTETNASECLAISQPIPEHEMSGETIHTSPPHASTTRPPAAESKPKRPSLSFAEAKRIREKRGFLSPEARQLLQQLKDRDHVRRYPATRFSPLMRFGHRCS